MLLEFTLNSLSSAQKLRHSQQVYKGSKRKRRHWPDVSVPGKVSSQQRGQSEMDLMSTLLRLLGLGSAKYTLDSRSLGITMSMDIVGKGRSKVRVYY
jgi:hypothetical protein